jgi:hypothetical protein
MPKRRYESNVIIVNTEVNGAVRRISRYVQQYFCAIHRQLTFINLWSTEEFLFQNFKQWNNIIIHTLSCIDWTEFQ